MVRSEVNEGATCWLLNYEALNMLDMSTTLCSPNGTTARESSTCSYPKTLSASTLKNQTS